MSVLAVMQPTGFMPAHGDPVQSLAFGPNGKVVATGDTARRLVAWHGEVPFFEAVLSNPHAKANNKERLRAITFSPGGDAMYVLCGDQLRVFDLLARVEKWSFQPKRFLAFLAVSPMAIAVSPSGNLLVSMDSGHVAAFSTKGQQICSWWDNDGPRHLAFARSGLTLIGAYGSALCAWEPYTGRRLKRVRWRERIFAMSLSPLLNLLAVRTLHSVELVDADSLATVASVAAPPGLPLVAFSPEGDLLALAGREEVLLMDIQGRLKAQLPTLGARVLSLAFRSGRRVLAAGCSDGVVRFWRCDLVA